MLISKKSFQNRHFKQENETLKEATESVSLRPFFFFFFNLFTYLWLRWGLRCCAQAFSSCGEWGLLFVAVRGLLVALASLVVEHGL